MSTETVEEVNKFKRPLANRLRNSKVEPYWVGSVYQVFYIIVAAAMALYSVKVGYVVVAIFAFISFVLPSILVAFFRRYMEKKKPGVDLKVRYEEDCHIPANFTPEHAAKRAKNPYFDNISYVFHVLHFVMFFVALFAIASFESYTAAIVLALGIGFFYAPVAESYSHEFVHRRSLFQQMLGASVWATYCYGTFLPEHTMGHHVHVSTPEDPSSAPKNMTIYKFLPIAIANNAINGFKLEAKRLRDRDASPWGVRNRAIWLTLFSVFLAWSAWAIAGGYGLAFFVAQTFGGVMTIEVANYVMHYGLSRKKLENGRYERVSPLHSWNREGFTNFFVTNLMRHSDHHAFPRRPYQNLRHFPDAPELPLPYEALLYMPYFPNTWFKIMNPAVDEHMKKLEEWRASGVDDYQQVMDISADRVR